MSFRKLFGKKDGDKNAPKPDKNEQIQLMIDQIIKEQELRLNNLETRVNALQDEAKAKLKAGDKAGAKRILAKKKKLVEQMKQIERDMAMMEEQKMKLDNCQICIDLLQRAIINAGQGVRVDDLQDMKDQIYEVDQGELNNFFKDYADEDQEDVDEELELLEQQMAQEDTNDLPFANKEQLYPVQSPNEE